MNFAKGVGDRTLLILMAASTASAVAVLSIQESISFNAHTPAEIAVSFAERSAQERPTLGQGDVRASGLPTSQFRADASRAGTLAEALPPLGLTRSWVSETFNYGIHEASKASPAVDTSGVYVGSDAGWFYKFSLSGIRQWRFRTGSSQYGIHSTAALDEQLAYFGAYNGTLYALQKSDGSVAWQTKLGDAIGASPMLVDGFLYIAVEYSRPRDGRVYKLDPKTGRTVWASHLLGEQVHSSPAADSEGRIFIGANNGKVFALDALDGREIWSADAGGDVKSTPAVIGKRVFVSSWGKKLSAFSTQTGKRECEAKLDSISQSSPTYDPLSSTIVLASHKSNFIYGISEENCSIKWKKMGSREATHLNFGTASGVAIRSKRDGEYAIWIACGAASLCALRAGTGEELAHYELPGMASGSAAFGKRAGILSPQLYIAINNGGLVALGEKR